TLLAGRESAERGPEDSESEEEGRRGLGVERETAERELAAFENLEEEAGEARGARRGPSGGGAEAGRGGAVAGEEEETRGRAARGTERVTSATERPTEALEPLTEASERPGRRRRRENKTPDFIYFPFAPFALRADSTEPERAGTMQSTPRGGL